MKDPGRVMKQALSNHGDVVKGNSVVNVPQGF